MVRVYRIYCIIFFAFSILWVNSFSQEEFNLKAEYDTAFIKLKQHLISPSVKSFKEAIFISENVFSGKKYSSDEFNSAIDFLANLASEWAQANSAANYHFSDSINFILNFAIYSVLKDTVRIKLPNGTVLGALPYTYDFNDFFGHSDWRNMFVTKLLSTQTGNCHSLPYLYKILADELGAKCWLSLAPNHIYIKNRCKKIGWYNTELTSGDFPIDAWITTSGYISVKAVQAGIYMDTLSNQQAIGLCILDLAKGYEFQTKNYYDGFIIKCCDLVLQYHPVNIMALLLKAETLKHIYQKRQNEKCSDAITTYNEMEQVYVKLFDLGYREMPDKMYQQWLRSVTEQKNKYSNKQLGGAFKNRTNRF
jgi:hypothetical protein